METALESEEVSTLEREEEEDMSTDSDSSSTDGLEGKSDPKPKPKPKTFVPTHVKAWLATQCAIKAYPMPKTLASTKNQGKL